MSHIPRDNRADPYYPPSGSANHSTAYTEPLGSGDDMPPPQLPVEVAPSGKKRKPSKTKLPAELRKTASTPHIRGINNHEASPLASPTSEKRRNKLGYHRTSVACGHCRRRKIRCLIANDDTTGRCANCIRLKKDCHFFPVDQGPVEVKSRATIATEAPTQSTSLSAHSSPRNSATSESVDEISRTQSHPSHQQPFSIHSSTQSSELEYSESPIDGAPFQSPTFSYQGMPDTGAPWSQPTFFGSQHINEEPGTPHSTSDYWAQSHPPNHPIYQHRGSIPAGLDPQAGYYAPPPIEESAHPWPGMRSMSVGDASQLPPGFQPPYRQHGAHPSPYSIPFSQTMPTGPASQTMPTVSTTSHVLPSQSLPSQSLPNDWSSYANPDFDTPVAEHHQTPFGEQWYSHDPHSGPGSGAPSHPATTHPG